MKKVLAATVFAAGLAGCSSAAAPPNGDKQAMIEACVKLGETREACNCSTNAFEENLDNETFALMAKDATQPKGASHEEFLRQMTPERSDALMRATMASAMKCRKPGS